MLNYVWSAIIILCIVFGVLNNRSEEMLNSLLTGAADGVALTIKLFGTMCLWNGISEIISKSGADEKIARLLKIPLSMIFPKIKNEGTAMAAIAMNVSANLLGLGNAATPLGLKAMAELQQLNSNKKAASNEMIMFVVMNTASMTLVPTTVASLRAAAGSKEPLDILFAVWITSFLSLSMGLCAVKVFEWVNKFGKNRGLRGFARGASKRCLRAGEKN